MYPIGVSNEGERAVERREITARLRRVEGQIRGLERMVDEERDCETILIQLMAARSALDKVGLLVVSNYIDECLPGEDPKVKERAIRPLQFILSRYSPSLETEELLSEEEQEEKNYYV
jgi:DNA-binding FrmR family transcriptional regulator